MSRDNEEPDVIHSADWLKEKGIERFRAHDLTGARDAFEKANDLAPDDPSITYALGHCEAAANKWWRALYRFVESIYLGRTVHDDTVEYLRSAAVAARHLKFTELAENLLLGARARNHYHPQVLESLGRLYEQQERWLEAITVRDELIEVLKGNDPRRTTKLLSPAMESTPIHESQVQAQKSGINAQMRAGFQVVDETMEPEVPDARMSRTTHPPGLHTLIENLSSRERAVELLESAQSIWARAHHERFDAHLSPYILAATTQWIVERLHFAIPTDVTKLEADFGVQEEQIRAAARLILSQFKIRVISPEVAMRGLGAQDGAYLSRMFQALLLDTDVESLDPQRMLI